MIYVCGTVYIIHKGLRQNFKGNNIFCLKNFDDNHLFWWNIYSNYFGIESLGIIVFLNSRALESWDRIITSRGSSPVHCRMFGRISGLSQVGISPTPFPWSWQSELSPDIDICPLWSKISPGEKQVTTAFSSILVWG